MNPNHVFSAFSFISFVLASIPFVWHLEALNTATCLYMFWVSISNLSFFVNSVVWDGNVVNWSPIWCDISGRINIGTGIAIPATCLCIQRRIYHLILNPSLISAGEKRRRLIVVDMMIGLGLPTLHIILSYTVQPQRYDIYEDFGCRIPLINTVLGVVLVPAWKLGLSLISGIYRCINLYHIWINQRMIKQTLGSSLGGLNSSRYLRLFILSGIDLLITIPFNIWVFTTWFPVFPWISWTTLHYGFSRVDTFPAALWREDPTLRASAEGTRWINVVYAIVFFVLFGFTEEARRRYASTLKFVAKNIGYKAESKSGSSEPPVLEHRNVQPVNSTWSEDGATTVFSECRHPPSSDGSKPLEFSDGKIQNLGSKYDLESAESKFTPSEDLDSVLTVPQFHKTFSPPTPMTADLEATRGGAQAPV